MRRVLVGLTAALALAVVTDAEAQSKKTTGKQGDVNVFVRGGVGDYTGELSDYTDTGPTWGATLNMQPLNVLGYEITYDGSRNLIDDDRLAESPALTRHGVSALVKLAPPFIERVRPFIGAGLGASMINVGDATGLYEDDFVEEVPLAAGIEFNTGALHAGLRTTYRWLIDESFADNAAPVGNPQGGLLDAQVTVGGRF